MNRKETEAAEDTLAAEANNRLLAEIREEEAARVAKLDRSWEARHADQH